MARRQSRVNVEALGLLITDAVMRALVPAVNQRVADACERELLARLAPIATQVAELGEHVRAARESLGTLASVAQLDERLHLAVEACEAFCDKAVTRAFTDVRPFTYHGPHDIARDYGLNDSVTHRGCMWMARSDVPAGIVPGSDAGAEYWTLAVKSGRDAKGRDT